MQTGFEDFNSFVYYSVRGVLQDVVIWCLGPYVDHRLDHGKWRVRLALVTRSFVRRWYGIED